MAGSRWVVLIAALIFWAGFFYVLDTAIMEGQGLPVSADLMPA